MVEMAPAQGPRHYELGFAGDTFNTAWYAKAIAPAWQSRFVSRVGTDAVSDQMVQMMGQSGIETDHILRSPDRSVGLYLISLDKGERSFSYWRDQSAARQLANDTTALSAAVADARYVYFSGITMAILDAQGRAALLEAVAAARAAGATTVFDSNLRPRLWTSGTEMTETIMQAAQVSDIVLPSYDDDALHFGDTSVAATLDRYLKAGATTVVVKNGAGEIHFSHQGETGSMMPTVADLVVDTTSAGDSFNAGFLAALDVADTVQDALVLAARLAAHVIGHKGALVPIPDVLRAEFGVEL